MPVSQILLSLETDTKKEEQKIIEELLMRLQYTHYKLEPCECPDFIATINGSSIGIEVTKYYTDYSKNGSEIQKKISEWKRTAVKLRTRLIDENRNYANLYGAIHFRKEPTKYKCLFEKRNFCELISFVKSNAPNINEQITVDILQEYYPALYQIIESIYLRNFKTEDKYLWWDGSLQSGQVINNPSAVGNIIKKKEADAKSYIVNYHQKWLVIYAGGTGLHDLYTNDTEPLYRHGSVTMKQIDKDKIISNSEMSSYSANYFTHILLWDKYSEIIWLLHPHNKIIFDWGEKKIYINHLPLRV